jgi:hypothetical protein
MDTTTIIMIILGAVGALCLWWLVDWYDKYYEDGQFNPPEERD